jgi:hypothetical protein
MLVMPFIGLHAVEGIAADDYDAGLRLGTLLGTRLEAPVSLNVEVAFDILSPKKQVGDRSISGHDLTVAFAPLFHGSAGPGELVVGPKLGYWSSSITEDNSNVVGQVQASQTGWAFGFNVGGFGAVSDVVAIGAMLSYQMTHLSQSCVRSASMLDNGCTTSGPVPQILSFQLAALF